MGGFFKHSIACALVLFVHEARADLAVTSSIGVDGAWLRKTPTLSAEHVSTAARELDEGNEVKTRGHLVMAGLAGDLELSIDDRWRVPLVGAGVYIPVGSYATDVTSDDGSITRLRPWSAFRVDLLLPGFGRRFTHRRWQWGASVRGGFSWLSMKGAVAAGRELENATFTATSPVVQIELDACRRLDPLLRACLQVAPRLYDFGPVNGFTVGFRMEWD